MDNTLFELAVDKMGENFDMFNEYKKIADKAIDISVHERTHPNGNKYICFRYRTTGFLGDEITTDEFLFRNGEWQWNDNMSESDFNLKYIN